MFKRVRFFVPFLVASLFLAGCPKKQPPTPADTRMGEESGDFVADGDYAEGDYVDGEEAGAYGISGLKERSSGDGMDQGRERLPDVLPSVYFAFDRSAIRQEERSKLRKASEYLKNNQDVGLMVEGHTDWYGTAEYNLALGDRRARSVKQYLETLGIDAERLKILSKGELEAETGLSKSKAAEDRRADLIVLR